MDAPPNTVGRGGFPAPPRSGGRGGGSPPRPALPPRSRPCSLEEQYFKCGIFWDYDTAQRHASNSEAPVLAGGVSVFLRGTQFSGASELKEGLVSKCKFI